MHRLALLLVGSSLVGCSASPGPVSPAEDVRPAEAVSAPEPAGSGVAAKAVVGNEASAAGLPDRASLEQKKSLDPSETPFPSIEEVTKDLGAPHAKAKTERMQYWYDTKTEGALTSCDTLDVIGLPSGAATLHGSVYSAKDCKQAKSTGKQVKAVLLALGAPDEADVPIDMQLSAVGALRLDTTAKRFRDTVGAPNVEEDLDVAVWKYRGDDESCRLLVVSTRLQTHAGQVLWEVPCE